jgi:hypothetical protein
MTISSISDGELGSSVRTKLNALVTHANNNTGWASYADTTYTSGSPFVVSVGTTVSLPNNAATTIVSQLPTGSTGLYDGTRITPDASGDSYDVRMSFQGFSSVNEGAFALSLDISAAGDGSITIASAPVRMVRGSGAGNVQLYTVAIPVFTLGTFLTNGGLIRIEAVDGNITVYDISYVLIKNHAAR